ncbi:Cys-tRNA(Pro) deacylase [Chitinimonas arctica]|uniref:Cys-tRNA(Pro)/Cys-tRNA(Cys) deacylase n=1 Tax=Chitinimonas arctica TaxID=2594795 RepID=A0A516SD91_9NEIS|nr:Cys-tRNA(Pro) deacylase [Chitinimonas arctica]QDQ26116.1 Cys-tRNA(Pro) deacylase [Chitinimonas arctica]
MSQSKSPVTAAIRVLRQHGVSYAEHLYDYLEKGGTAESSRQLGVDEHAVIKTLVMEDESRQPLIVLMHGDCETSTRNLARQAGRRHIEPCTAETANRHTGYLVGGTSPLGTRKPLPVFLEKSILDLERIYLNGGKRGFLVSLAPQDLLTMLQPTLVEVANPR